MTHDTFPFILVDGSGYIFRAYYALPSLTRPDGGSVGAVFGFTSMLLKLLDAEGRDGLVVIFDAGRKTFRNTLYPAYKENRPPPPDDLIPQFPLTRLACEALGVPWLESDGFEADDLIASYTKKALESGRDVRIISSDKDLMQLIKPGVTFFDPMKQRLVDESGVVEKFGVLPNQVCDVLSLMGDASDNIPGVPGIGPKGASHLIGRFGTLAGLLDHIEDIEKPSHRKALEEYKDQALLSQSLVCLDHDVALPIPIDDLKTKPLDMTLCMSFLKKQGFSSLIPRLEKYRAKIGEYTQNEDSMTNLQGPATEWAYVSLSNRDELKEVVAQAAKASYLSVLLGENCDQSKISFCFDDKRAYTIILAPEGNGDLFSSRPGDLTFKEALKILAPLLQDQSLMKVGQDIKQLQLILEKYNLDLVSFQDLLLMGYDVSGCRTGQTLNTLVDSYLELSYEDKKSLGLMVSESGVSMSQDKKDAAEVYLGLMLMSVLPQRLVKEQVSSIYECVDKPVIPVLSCMEKKGILVSAERLKLLGQEFGAKMSHLEGEIFALAGRSFSIGSPKQLAEILYTQMGFETGAKGKSGEYSTKADILEGLAAQGHRFPQLVLEWRGLAKLKNTYADGLLEYINPKDSRIHTSMSLIATSTGRLVSFNPNLQNIPIRTEEGVKIRRAFCVPEHHVFLSLDYSQIELRLLAHMANIPALVDAFWKNQDVHAITAAHVFDCPLEKVDKVLRRKAKIINFGIIYGISPFGLAQQLGISRGEAKEHIDAYFKTYPGIQEYMEAKKEEARQKGYVETLWGRRCRIVDIHSSNAIKRGFAERQAINAPLQGTAADIIKKAMIQSNEWEKDKKAYPSLLLQVHDELLFEVPEEEFKIYAQSLKDIMEGVIKLSVPLVADVSKGTTWGDLMPVEAFS